MFELRNIDLTYYGTQIVDSSDASAPEDEVKHYGGRLIAESVNVEVAPALVASVELLNACQLLAKAFELESTVAELYDDMQTASEQGNDALRQELHELYSRQVNAHAKYNQRGRKALKAALEIVGQAREKIDEQRRSSDAL